MKQPLGLEGGRGGGILGELAKPFEKASWDDSEGTMLVKSVVRSLQQMLFNFHVKV